MEKAEALSDERKQCEILNKLFGDDFEVPEPPTGGSKTNRAIYGTGRSRGALRRCMTANTSVGAWRKQVTMPS